MAHLHCRRPDRLAAQRPETRGRLIRWARYYDPFVSLFTLGRRAELRRATVALARLRPDEQVLEVGCGTGDVAVVASAHVGAGGAVTGIDPVPEMIAVARDKAAQAGVNVNFQVGVIEALAFPDHTFDVVFSSLMLHHLPDDVKRQGIAEIVRVLKPGGRLLIVDFTQPSSQMGRALAALALHGDHWISIQEIQSMLQGVGFTSVAIGETGFRLLGFVRGHIPR